MTTYSRLHPQEEKTMVPFGYGILRAAPLLAGLLLAGTALGADFKLNSPDFKNGRFMPEQYYDNFGCTGNNTSPELRWSGAPPGTKSFVITLFDPDAPTGSGFWHWGVANIPLATTSLPQGAGSDATKMPAGVVQTNTDYGAAGYGGPCPPKGSDHHYRFTIYALRVDKLDVNEHTTGAVLGFMVHFNTIGQATFTVRAAH
jgi:Raf kinase inhibitor-like YbhB/YbcL family protein